MKILANIRILITLLIIFSLAVFLRFYQLNNIPAGLHADEAAQGYNAFSLLHTGKDMYGQKFPILFRSNGSYQPPLYTYLSILPVYFFGNSAFSIRVVSAISGVVLLIFTYLFISLWDDKKSPKPTTIGIFTIFILAYVPWAVHFSRIAVEANLALTIFVASLLLFRLSLKNHQYLLLAALVLGVTTHTYYSEKLIAVIFLPLFILLFWQKFRSKLTTVFAAGILFFITQIPTLLIVQTGALTTRLSQVSSVTSTSPWNTLRQIFNEYLMYLSPGRLFLDPGGDIGRSAPELSMFYNWLFITFLFGIHYLWTTRKQPFTKLLFSLLIISLLPASLTGDVFYPLRTMEFLWILTILIGIGLWQIWQHLRSQILRFTIFTILLAYSLVNLYVSYFILYKYEAPSANYGYALEQLAHESQKYPGSQIQLDNNPRFFGAGVQLAYLLAANPIDIQSALSSQMQTPYYSNKVNSGEVFSVNNIILKPINWGEVCKKDLITVGDRNSVSDDQISEHQLKLVFTISNPDWNVVLFGYSAKNPCNK